MVRITLERSDNLCGSNTGTTMKWNVRCTGVLPGGDLFAPRAVQAMTDAWKKVVAKAVSITSM